jgi:hypothetical protein
MLIQSSRRQELDLQRWIEFSTIRKSSLADDGMLSLLRGGCYTGQEDSKCWLNRERPIYGQHVKDYLSML